jgi:hypothetical protein
VGLEIDSKIAAYPGQLETPSIRLNPRVLAAQEPSYGWTVNMPLQPALRVACSAQFECRRASAGGLVRPPTAGARVYPSAPHTAAKEANFAPITSTAAALWLTVPRRIATVASHPFVEFADSSLGPRCVVAPLCGDWWRFWRKVG